MRGRAEGATGEIQGKIKKSLKFSAKSFGD